MSTELLSIRDLTKIFPGVKALDSVQFSLKAGSVHAVCGENGAGKSTLMNVLMGIYQRDGGDIIFKGEPVNFSSPGQAIRAGIAIIEQELNPVPEMTVAENLFLGREFLKGKIFIDSVQLHRKTSEVLKTVGLTLNPATKMKHLSLAQIQLVEIAKAVSYDTDVIIMDEPTSAIGEKDVDYLFSIIRGLQKKGKGIIYVSHRMKEIYTISDTITVFRDGRYIDSKPTSELPMTDLVSLMVGRKLEEEYVKTNTPGTGKALEVKSLSKKHLFNNINLSAHKGEIVGIFGLMGSGRSEFFDAISGVNPADEGEIEIFGEQKSITRPSDAIRSRIAYVTEDRKLSGLVLTSSVSDNISLPNLKKLSTSIFIQKKKELAAVKEQVDKLRVKTPSMKQLVSRLSGGNQQKVVLGKWLLSDPNILLLDEPTRGIDVGAKREIYAFMSQFASEGKCVLMISSEIPEVMGMSDKIVVFKDGQIVAERKRGELDQDELMSLASAGNER